MPKRLTKRQIDMFAKIHISVHACYFDGFAVDEVNSSEEDKDRLVDAVHELGRKISKGQPLNFPSNRKILDYVRNNF